MNPAKWKSTLKRWLRPTWPLFLLVCGAAAFLLVEVFLRRLSQHPLAYGIYALSTYALCLLVVRAVGWWNRLRRWSGRVPIIVRWRTDRQFRAKGRVLLGLAVSVGYSLFKAAMGLWFRSVWFGAAAFYYIALSVLRLWLLRQLTRPELSPEQQHRGCRLGGWLLLGVSLPVALLGVQMVAFDHAAQYPGFVIYAAAAYTFYSMGSAVANLVRMRREKAPLLAAVGAADLAKALVALFSLQSALLAAFGGTPAANRPANALTGGAVFSGVCALALWLILRSSRALRQPEEA